MVISDLVRNKLMLELNQMLDLIQWPAMVVTVIAAWMVGSQKKFKRNWGFWLFLFSNVLWIVWGWQDGAYALIVLQDCLAPGVSKHPRSIEECLPGREDCLCSPIKIEGEAI